MTNYPLIQCSQCGQMNRIPPHQPGHLPLCGKCRAVLHSPPQHTTISSGRGIVRGLTKHAAWLLLIGIIAVAYYVSTRHTSQRPPHTARRLQPSFQHPQLAIPYSGSVRRFTTDEPLAPFEIKAAQGSHYLLKLVDAYTKVPVLTVFVQSGSMVKVEVPLGTYEVRYASGDAWYGYEHLFGPSTSYSKADKTFTFEVDGNQISGFTITLYKVAHGNLHTSGIRPTEF